MERGRFIAPSLHIAENWRLLWRARSRFRSESVPPKPYRFWEPLDCCRWRAAHPRDQPRICPSSKPSRPTNSPWARKKLETSAWRPSTSSIRKTPGRFGPTSTLSGAVVAAVAVVVAVAVAVAAAAEAAAEAVAVAVVAGAGAAAAAACRGVVAASARPVQRMRQRNIGMAGFDQPGHDVLNVFGPCRGVPCRGLPCRGLPCRGVGRPAGDGRLDAGLIEKLQRASRTTAFRQRGLRVPTS